MAKKVKIGEAYFDVRAHDPKFDEDLKNLKNQARKGSENIQKDLDKINTKGARDEFGRFVKTTATGSSSVKKSIGNIISKMTAIIGSLYLVKEAWNWTKEAKNAARDAEEVRNKFDTVFSNISEGANRTADDFAALFKLAGSTARELLSNTGDLLVGFGFNETVALNISQRVNSLAQDLASFTNYSGGAKGASEALTKALLGETESAKSLGIVIRQDSEEFKRKIDTLVQAEGMTLQQAKAVTILDEAYKQSGKAVGDFARTSDSLANQERITQERYKATMESLGKGLIPTFIQLTKVATGYLIIAQKIAGIKIPVAAAGGTRRAEEYRKNLMEMSKEQLEHERAILAKKWEQNDAEIKALELKDKLNVNNTGLNDEEEDRLHLLKLQRQVMEEQAYAFGEFDKINKQKEKTKDIETLTTLTTKLEELKDKKANISIFDLPAIIAVNREISAIENKIKNIENKGLEKSDKNKLLEKEAKLYRKLYFATEKWYKKSIELIKDQAEKLIKTGISKKDALEWEKQKIEELNRTYEKYKITLEGLNKLSKKKYEITMSPTKTPDKKTPRFPDEEELQALHDQFSDDAALNWADTVVSAADIAKGAMAGFFEDIYLRGEQYNSMLEKLWQGMANAFISQVQRMIAEWLAFQAIRGIMSIIPGAGSILTALSSAGTSAISSISAGAAQAMPASPMAALGFNSNSLNLSLVGSSSSNKNDAGIKTQLEIINMSIQALNQNLIKKDFSPQIKIKSQLESLQFVEDEVNPNITRLSKEKSFAS